MIRIDDLSVHVGGFTLDGISLEVPTGRYGVLMGKTGCGKTTLLEAISGLKSVRGGRVVLGGLGGRDVTRLKPAERGIGYVPQDRALFPTMTVLDHLAFSLVVRRWGDAAIAHRVEELASLLGLEHLLHRKPHGLSGGEAQRVALGRALASRPPVLLLDEPLSALDDETREEMVGRLESVRQHTGVTVLHVTHNRGEAKRLADRLFRLHNGKIAMESTARSGSDGNGTASPDAAREETA